MTIYIKFKDKRSRKNYRENKIELNNKESKRLINYIESHKDNFKDIQNELYMYGIGNSHNKSNIISIKYIKDEQIYELTRSV